jgi:hypothetical protein
MLYKRFFPVRLHRQLSALLLTAALCTVSHQASAGLVASDSFNTGDYGPGTLEGQNPALAGWSGGWMTPGWGAPNNISVVSNGLDYPGLVTSGGAAQANPFTRVGRLLETPHTDATNATVYMSILMQMPNIDNSHYRALELHNGGFDDGAHRKLQLGTHGGDLGNEVFGVRLFNNNDFRIEMGAADTNVNLFVLRFDFSSVFEGDSVTIWHNPTSLGGAEPGGAAGTLSNFNLEFDRVTLAHFESGFGNPGMFYDEVRLGTTWADVTPIPEPRTYALLAGLGVLALAALRRGRTT